MDTPRKKNTIARIRTPATADNMEAEISLFGVKKGE